MIWGLGALIAALAIAGLAAPWWWPAFAQRTGLRRRTANVAVYRGRLQELEADVGARVVPRESVEGVKQELASRLMQDVDAPVPAPLRLAPSRGILVAAALGLIAFAALWYGFAGSWRTQALVELAQADPESARAAALDDMIQRLRERVADQPGDADSWAWLARSYRNRGNHADAAKAFARANELKGQQDPDLLVEEGEALAYTQDRSMAGIPAQKFAQALALAPDHAQGLWYAGIAALQAGDDRAAIAHWERLMQQALPDDTRATLEHSLAQLRDRAGIKAPPATASTPALGLNISVSVAPEFAAEIRPDDTMFVYALDAAGPRMPLAVRRLSAGALPLQTTLDDSNSMTPARKLSSVARWRVIARVSRSGAATAQSGDLQGELVVGRKEAQRPLRLEINSRVP